MKLALRYKKVIVFGLWSIVGLLAILPASICEILYGNLIYPAVRYLFHMVSFISFPLIYILIGVCIYLIWRLFAVSDSIKSKGISLLKGIAWALALFYLSWAFNYRRPAFDSKLPLDRSPLDSADWYKELFFAKTELESTRPVKLTDYTLKETEEKVRKEVKLIANEFGYHAPGKIRVKSLWPEGFLLRIKTAGFYLPYAGEAYIDPGLHPIQHAYTLAHEMCHGYGVTDEGACNFLAYLALRNISDSTLKYSAQMAYYRYVASEYRFRYPGAYTSIRDSLPVDIKKDLDEINANLLKYPDLFPKLRDKVYENYLQLQGIKEGMASYDNVIGYVRQYRKAGKLN